MDVAKGGSWHFGFFMVSEYPEMLTTGRERQFLKTFAYRDSAHIKDAISEQDIDEYLALRVSGWNDSRVWLLSVPAGRC